MSKENERQLKHLKIYKQLLEEIQNGTYPPGTKLPSEPELADMMNVSRMTLRKALSLLQEEGMLQNIHGKGNYIRKRTAAELGTGMEIMQHPFYGSSRRGADEVELCFRLEPADEVVCKRLEQKTPVVVILERWYKKASCVCGYTKSWIPIEIFSEEKIDLNENEQLKQFFEQEIYEKYRQVNYTYTTELMDNIKEEKYTISEEKFVICIEEKIYKEEEKLALIQMHYLPLEDFSMKLHARKSYPVKREAEAQLTSLRERKSFRKKKDWNKKEKDAIILGIKIETA